MTRKILLVSLLYLGYWGIIQFAGHNFDLNVTAYGGVMRCLVGFGIGMITYAGYVRLRVWNGMGRSAWLAGAGVMTVAGMHAGISDIFIVALFPVLIFLAARNTGAMARLLDRRFFQQLGEQSYSIYMIHVPLMSTFLVGWLVFRTEKSVGVDNASALALTPVIALSGCLVYALLVLVLSTLTFRYVESPMRQWLNQRLRVETGAGPAAITRQKTPG